jgi:hypothetical protein
MGCEGVRKVVVLCFPSLQRFQRDILTTDRAVSADGEAVDDTGSDVGIVGCGIKAQMRFLGAEVLDIDWCEVAVRAF